MNNNITFEQALAIVVLAQEKGYWYANAVSAETLAVALMASMNYMQIERDYVIIPQTRKVAKGEHGAISCLGGLIIPTQEVISRLLNGRAFNWLGVLDNGCLQVMRVNTSSLDFGDNMKRWPWLETEYHTYNDIPEDPKATEKCVGKRARMWEKILRDKVDDWARNTMCWDVKKTYWVGGFNNVQNDIVVELNNGKKIAFEVKGLKGRVASFKKEKKAKKNKE